MIKKYKNYLLGVIGILIALTMFVGVKYLMKPKYEELPEVKLVKLKEIKDSKSFAIMVQNGESYEEYKSEDNTWPGTDYVFKEAKCTDNNGTLVENAITFENDTAILETDKTIYCTLYFDEKPIPEIVKKLKANDTQGYLSKDPQGGMYRYQATPADAEEAANMTNWICFGTTDKEQCINEDTGIEKYMYRIIGITKEGQLYLLKETFLKEAYGTIVTMYKRTIQCNESWRLENCLEEKCEWPNVDLYKRLNGKTSNGDPLFVDSSEYGYMAKNSDWYNLIEEHNWMYGDTNNRTDSIKYSGKEMYAIETGKTATKRYWPDEGTQTTCSSDSPCTEKEYTWSKSVPAKIGLMYMHDVDYAYTGGNPGSSTNVKNSWIHFQKDRYNSEPYSEWLISRAGVGYTNSTAVYSYVVNYDGSLGYDSVVLNHTNGVRPTFYLSSEAKIKDGDGTKANPYVLDVQE